LYTEINQLTLFINTVPFFKTGKIFITSYPTNYGGIVIITQKRTRPSGSEHKSVSIFNDYICFQIKKAHFKKKYAYKK